MNKLFEEITACRLCEETFGFEPKPVVWGNKHSKIFQISQAPSKTVNETLKPFSDQSGKKLKYEWYQITDEEFYSTDNFYIAAMGHCYPGKDAKGNDRKPPKCCYDMWIKKEMELVNNKLYIIIGREAASRIFPKQDFKELIFKTNELNGKPALVLPHPSPLNFRWLKENPDFLSKRIPEIRKVIKDILNGG